MKFKTVIAALALAAIGAASHAATIVRTFDVTASGFTGSGPAPLADPVHLNFTVTLDPAVSSDTSKTGLTINTFNLPYASAFVYNSDGDGYLLLGTHMGSNFCDVSAKGYCMGIKDPFGSSPHGFFNQTPGSGRTWSAANFVIAASAPEPGTWTLMLIGLGGLGLVLRSGRRTASINANIGAAAPS